MDDEYEDHEDEALHHQMRQQRMRMMMMDGGPDENGEDAEFEMEKVLDLEDVKGPLQNWLKKQDVVRHITKQFNQFLRNFKNNDTNAFVYEDKIHEMC